MGSRKTASARALIEPEVKKEAEKILNEKTMKAIENSRQGKGKAFPTPQELFDDLGI